jgi:polyferredoxin
MKPNRTTPIRRLVQLAFTAFIIVASIRHSTSTEHLPSVDAFCPFGAVETLWTFATTGSFVQKTHPSNFVAGLGLLIGAVLAGATFCGWVCPFGALHDLLTWVRKKLRLPELKVPVKLHKILTYGRYVTLIMIPLMTVITAKLWFSSYDPYRTIFSLNWLFEFNLGEHWPAYTIALLVIAGGLLIPRFWCRYLCPQSAILDLIQRISLFRIWRDKATCIDCGRCNQVCPTRLDVAAAEAVKGNCIGCLECIQVCPKDGALTVNLGRPELPQ